MTGTPSSSGSLLANLQALEFFMRAALYKAHSGAPLPRPFDELSVGDEVAENPLTDYASLSQVIQRYNDTCAGSAAEQIDPTIIELRDALAHGRVTAPTGEPHFGIVKFSRSEAGRAKVTFAAVLTRDWLREQRLRVAREGRKVRC